MSGNYDDFLHSKIVTAPVGGLEVKPEELSELQKELTKWLRGKCNPAGLLEEMADVSIMLNQLQLIFGDPTEQEIAKLERLERLVHGGD